MYTMCRNTHMFLRHPHVHFLYFTRGHLMRPPPCQARKSQTEVAISVMHRCAEGSVVGAALFRVSVVGGLQYFNDYSSQGFFAGPVMVVVGGSFQFRFVAREGPLRPGTSGSSSSPCGSWLLGTYFNKVGSRGAGFLSRLALKCVPLDHSPDFNPYFNPKTVDHMDLRDHFHRIA